MGAMPRNVRTRIRYDNGRNSDPPVWTYTGPSRFAALAPEKVYGVAAAREAMEDDLGPDDGATV